MINYQSIMYHYNRIHRRIWVLLFRGNFKRFGKTSRIAFPLSIQNAKYIEIGENVNILKRTWLVAVKIDHSIPKLVIEDFDYKTAEKTLSKVEKVLDKFNDKLSTAIFEREKND